MNKRRNNFLNILLVTILSILILSACSSSSSSSDSESGNNDNNSDSKEQVVLKIASHIHGNHSQFKKMIEPLMEEIEEKTDGRVVAEYYTGGVLGDSSMDYDLAATGSADIAIGQYGYTPGKFPLSSFNDLPFLGDSSVEATKLFWALHEQFPEFSEEHENTKILWLFKIDPYQIFTNGKKVTSIEDMKGLKIRTPSDIGSRMLELLGAEPVSMGIGEIYEGMDRGIIDGALLPASTVVNYQLDEVTDYIVKGDFMTIGLFAVMNEDSWNSLSDEDKEIIESLIGEKAALKAAEVYDQDGEEGWKRIQEKGEIEVYELSDEEKQEWEEVFSPIYEEWIQNAEDKGLPGQEVYDFAKNFN